MEIINFNESESTNPNNSFLNNLLTIKSKNEILPENIQLSFVRYNKLLVLSGYFDIINILLYIFYKSYLYFILLLYLLILFYKNNIYNINLISVYYYFHLVLIIYNIANIVNIYHVNILPITNNTSNDDGDIIAINNKFNKIYYPINLVITMGQLFIINKYLSNIYARNN